MTKKNDSINFDKLSIDPDAPVISPEAAKGDLFTNLSGENPQSDDTSADTVIIDFNEGEKRTGEVSYVRSYRYRSERQQRQTSL